MYDFCLNPFMNQVYFYGKSDEEITSTMTNCLNPFMNQVYFYMLRFSLLTELCHES